MTDLESFASVFFPVKLNQRYTSTQLYIYLVQLYKYIANIYFIYFYDRNFL